MSKSFLIRNGSLACTEVNCEIGLHNIHGKQVFFHNKKIFVFRSNAFQDNHFLHRPLRYGSFFGNSRFQLNSRSYFEYTTATVSNLFLRPNFSNFLHWIWLYIGLLRSFWKATFCQLFFLMAYIIHTNLVVRTWV